MASYGYGPPPPAPPPAQTQAAGGSYPHYGQPAYQQTARHSAPANRGGRGGHHSGGRGDYQGHAQPYPYSQAPPPQQYGQQNAGYPAPQQGPYPQQWQQNAGHGAHPSSHSQSSHAPLSSQNYHPNFAPQIYGHQSYGQQQPSYPPAQQPYGQQYPAAAQGSAAPQGWSPPQNVSHSAHYGGGRSRGGHHNDRGGHKTAMMGPPIRIGFDSTSTPDHAAPVSHPYPPPQPYGPPQNGAQPYGPGPYPPYQNTPHVSAGAPRFDHYQNSWSHGRGGYHGNSNRGRSHFGGDKMRHKKPGGTSHASLPPNPHQKPDATVAAKKKKRKTNTLGLTPGDESEEDDADEEAKLAEQYGADAPNPEDILAWIAERKSNFPTRSRAQARLAESGTGEKPKTESGKDNTISSLEKQQQRAERLRKQLEKVESSIKRKREQQDEGDEMRDVDAGESDSSDSKSDDEAPESLPVRPEAASFLPPPPKKADPTKHCKYYSTGGTCGKKGKCRFVHDPKVREAALKERERNGGRMTLQQRLILNDKDQEDLTIVRTLQYLKEKGIMKEPAVASGSGSEAAALSARESSQSPTAMPSFLPPPPIKIESPHGLPPQPPPSALSNANTVRYQGWNLSGFGNTGVKSGDL